MKNKIIDKQLNIKLINFSKLAVLRERWDDEKLSTSKLKKHNKWSVEGKFNIIEIELRLEHYLCKNILVDLKENDDLFTNYKKYFSSKNIKNGRIEQIIKNLKTKNQSPTVLSIRNLTFGEKISLWNSLKISIFKNKFMGIKKNDQKMMITAFENARNIRNGIAHLNSKKQIYSKLKELNSDPKQKIDKFQIYKKSINICRKMQRKDKTKNE